MPQQGGGEKSEPGDGSGRSSTGQEAGGASRPARVQFDSNTVDVRGMRVHAALATVEEAVSSAPADSCLFIVHGLGSGRLRSEVRALLARLAVARVADEPDSAGGCTVVDV